MDRVRECWSHDYAIIRFADACLRGVGQVWLMNNPLSGLLFLVAIVVADPWWGVSAAVGTVAATGASWALGLPRAARAAGLHGYNGALVGVALAVFGWGTHGPGFPGPGVALGWLLLLPVALVAALSTLVTVAVGAALTRSCTGLCPLTLPFQLATWAWLLQAYQSPYFPVHHRVEPGLLAQHGGWDFVPGDGAKQWSPPGYYAPPHGVLRGAAEASLRGLAQVFLLPSTWSGALSLLALAVHTRIGAALALGGSVAGFLTAASLGLTASTSAGPGVYDGLYGYNAALTALCVGGLMNVPTNWRVVALALASAVTATIFTGAAAGFLQVAGLPALTFPFVAATWTFQLLGGAADKRFFVPVAVADMTTPEEHLARWKTEQAREPPSAVDAATDPDDRGAVDTGVVVVV